MYHNRNVESFHNEHLLKLQNNEKEISRLSMKLYDLKKTKNKVSDLFSRLKYEEQIHDLETKISGLQNENSEDYLMKVSDVLRQYSATFDPNERSINQNLNTFGMNNFVAKKTSNNRGQLYNQYVSIVTNDALKLMQESTKEVTECSVCGEDIYISVNESHVVCSNCGTIDVYFQPNANGLTYEQEISTNVNVHFAYKRINHLRELLSQLQAKETSGIPEDVIDKIRAEFKKARIQNLSEITESKIKGYLKKLGLNKYYENTRQITNILNGKPPPVISNELYESFITMFTDIQEPFERVCPKNRKNFFSYNYILYKFCELLDQHELKQLFPLLKSREKLYQQDCIWKDICSIMEWPFIKSV